MRERDAIILERRRAGATLAAVGREFGMARERVRQIVAQMTERERRAAAADAAVAAGGPRSIPVDCAGLPVRAVNTLRAERLDTVGDVADAFARLSTAERTLPNFGKRSLADIRAMLERHGLLAAETDETRA